MENIEVDMTGDWESVKSPVSLTTIGIYGCISVAVTNDKAGKAWLIHSPEFSQNTDALSNMLVDADSTCPNGADLKVWEFGGKIPDDESSSDVERARHEVLCEIGARLPSAEHNNSLGQIGDVEVIFKNGAWHCTCTDSD